MPSKETYLITDTDGRMNKHKCEWDADHIERPERLEVILKAIKESGLLRECTQLEPVLATDSDVCLVHTNDYLQKLKDIANKSHGEQEAFSSNYEDIYLNEFTLEAAYLSLGSALKATELVLSGGGMLSSYAVLPAITHFTTKAAARLIGISRVLIVDWDVHAGQGTQYCIEDDPGIKLISIHRYQNGNFWPNLPESAIQTHCMYKSLFKFYKLDKNTINVPLNDIGYGDREYFIFMNFLVRPIIEEWKPELILISCGFDAALGDPEGEMEISPAGYGHFTGLLSTLGIPLCVVLEGGYFLESIAQDAVHSLRALVERRPSPFLLSETNIKPSFMKSIYSTIYVHRHNFKLLDNICEILERYLVINSTHKSEYKGNRQFKLPYPTRGLYRPRSKSIEDGFRARLKKICENYENHLFPMQSLNINFDGLENKIIFKTDYCQIKLLIYSIQEAVFIFFLCLPLLSFEFVVMVDSKPLYSICFDKFQKDLINLHDDTAKLFNKEEFQQLFEQFPILKVIIE